MDLDDPQEDREVRCNNCGHWFQDHGSIGGDAWPCDMEDCPCEDYEP